MEANLQIELRKAKPKKSVKVSYPLFVKRSKSNIFKRAIREDFKKKTDQVEPLAKILEVPDDKNELGKISSDLQGPGRLVNSMVFLQGIKNEMASSRLDF